MDDILLLQQPQAFQERGGESPDKVQAESLIVVLFYEFVEIKAETTEKI